jgi:hypothetical protein
MKSKISVFGILQRAIKNFPDCEQEEGKKRRVTITCHFMLYASKLTLQNNAYSPAILPLLKELLGHLFCSIF